MSFEIKGRVKGDKEVVSALNRAPNTFFFSLRGWLTDERANMLGSKNYKDSRGKTRHGYRDMLASRKLKKREGTWSRKVAHLFRGSVPFAKNINNLRLTMGVLGRSKHQLQRAMEMLQTGGTIRSGSQMPVPMYKNLAAIGEHGPWSTGDVRTGLKSKIFRKLASAGRLVGVKRGGKVFYFDKNKMQGGRKWKKTGFNKSALLFMGLHGIRIKRLFTGRLDFYNRFDKMQSSMVRRGQTAVDKATKRVEKSYG